MKGAPLQKATVDVATGLTGFNLEAPAKLLVPFLSPFRGTIPRRTIGGKATNWKRITAVTRTGRFSAAEGVKSSSFTLTTDEKAALYKSYGRSFDVTWEADIAGENYEDAKARAQTLALMDCLKEEELWILGGNVTALPAPGSVSVTAQTSGGALADGAYHVRIFALTLEAVDRASRIARPVAGNKYSFLSSPVPTIDTSVGFSVSSTEQTATVTGGGGAGQLTITWAAVLGAAAYAVYITAPAGGANAEKYQGVVTQTEVIATSVNTTSADDPTGGDTSADAASFDGIIPQLFAAGSGATLTRVNNPLSAAVGNQIPEIKGLIQDIYDRTKVVVDRLVMGWQELDTIDEKLSGVANDRISIVYNPGEGGVKLRPFRFYPSPIDGKDIPMESNPNLPGGMILGLIDAVPYPDSEVPSSWEMHMGKDITRLDYGLTAPKIEGENRFRGVLAGYAPALQGALYDIHKF